MDIEGVDLLVVGGGKAGKSLAMDLAKAGQKVAMIERAMIGGTCINVACIPTKTLINSGRLLQSMRRASEFGIVGAEHPRVDLELLRRRKEDVVGTMVKGQLASFTGSGMDFIMGEARFVAPRTVEVALNDGGVRTLRGADVVLNLGTEPVLPEIEGLAESRVQTSETFLSLESMPSSIIVLGGGYVGCEFADLLNTIGVQVTLVQRAAHLLPREDPDISTAIEKGFTDAGITLRLGESAQKISRATDGTVALTLSSGEIVTAEDILVAVGRTPMTAAAELERGGVEVDDRGFIRVDDLLRTTAEHVWAGGGMPRVLPSSLTPPMTTTAFSRPIWRPATAWSTSAAPSGGSSRTASSSLPNWRASVSRKTRRGGPDTGCGSRGCRSRPYRGPERSGISTACGRRSSTGTRTRSWAQHSSARKPAKPSPSCRWPCLRAWNTRLCEIPSSPTPPSRRA